MKDVAVNLLAEAVLGAGRAKPDAGFPDCRGAQAAAREASEDRHLAQRLARGDAAAFDVVVALHHERVRRLAARLLGWPAACEVDDVVQEVFVSVLESGKGFRGRSSVMTWLTAITLNKCRSRQRSVRAWLSMLGRVRELPAPQAPGAAAQVAEAERRWRVRESVRSLPPRDREVIVLHYLEHRSTEELAEILGIKRNAVEVRLHRARQRLRPRLAGLMEME